MKRLFASLIFACVVPLAQAAEPAPNTLTDAEKAEGWILLFDGKDASEHFRGYRKDKLPEGWVVEDGSLFRKGRGDIITKKKYASFELSIDWKISEGGNSGIIFKVVETDKAPFSTGPEAQIQDNVKGTHPQKAGWVFGLYSADMDTTRPAGEWNEFVLKCRKTSRGTYLCEHRMNGWKYFEYEIGSDDWNERLAKSKYRNAKDYAKADEGYICLQDHGDEVWFRNIKIRELETLE